MPLLTTARKWDDCTDLGEMVCLLGLLGWHEVRGQQRRLQAWIAACQGQAGAALAPYWDLNNPRELNNPDQLLTAMREWARPGPFAERVPLADRLAMLHCIVGNPCLMLPPRGSMTWPNPRFGSPVYCLYEPWRTWLTPTVVALATAAHQERLPTGLLDNHRLLVLADALEEAGCQDPLLAHLRNPCRHYPGCHVVATILNND